MTDALDLSTVTIVNGPDVRGWSITSAITEILLQPGTFRIVHTKAGKWPAVKFEDAEQEATVWIVVRIGGIWFTAGVERLRPGQSEKGLGKPSDVGDAWLNTRPLFGPMNHHTPIPGDLVGFFVTSGNQRLGNDHVVTERSAVVLIDWPSDNGGRYPPFETLTPTPAPAPPPGEPSVPLEDDLALRLLSDMERIVSGLEATVAAVNTLTAKIDALQAKGVRIHF